MTTTSLCGEVRPRYGVIGCLAVVAACGTEPGTAEDRAVAHTLARTPRAGASATTLQTDAAAQPLGIDDATPRLSWQVTSGARGVQQVGDQIVVAGSRAQAVAGRGEVWDSGVVASTYPFAMYGGPALMSRTRYHWTVRVWLQDGRVTDWAEPAWFETALLHAGDWRGQWIAGPERRLARWTPEDGQADDAAIVAAGEFCRPPQWPAAPMIPLISQIPNDQGGCRELRPAPLFRKSFEIQKRVVSARVYSAGLAYNDLQINGRAASDRVLDPVFTDYSRTVRYTTLDVTDLVRRGDNVIATELGSGKYDDATRTFDWGWDVAEWRATPSLRLDLYLRYADGTEQVVSSDDSWKVSVDGPRRFDSFYLGETYDARREIAGWANPGFDDARWASARVVPGPAGVLRAEHSEPSRVVAIRGPGVVWTRAPGVVVYDIGQGSARAPRTHRA